MSEKRGALGLGGEVDAHSPRLRWWVRLLDDSFRIPGTQIRFGIDALLGLIPGIGDSLTASGALVIFLQALREGVPATTIGRMLLNTVIDLLVGLIPGLGDIFDLFWRSNRKNYDLLEQHRQQGTPSSATSARALALLAIIIAAFAIVAPLLWLAYLCSQLWGS